MEQQQKTDADKVKGLKILLVAAIAVIVVLGVMVAYDTQKLMRAQNIYNNAWTECANLCNGKLNFLSERCNLGYLKDSIQPVVIPNVTSNETLGVKIELQ